MLITHTNNNKKIIPNCEDKKFIRISYYNNQFAIYPCCPYEMNERTKPYGILTKEDILNNNVFEKILFCKQEYGKNNPEVKQLYPGCDTIFYPQTPPYIINNHINPQYYCDFHLNKEIDTVNVSITQTCNLNCKMCGYDHSPNKEIDELYFKILEQLKGHNLKTIQLTQEGEPFFYKSRTINYLKSLHNNDCKNVFIVSNLTLLNENDIIDLHNIIINNNIKIIMHASIDGMTESTYKKIRRNNLFDKVIHNAELLIENKILKCINFVVQDDNIAEIPLVIEYCKMHSINCSLLPEGSQRWKYEPIINEYKQKFKFLQGFYFI